MTGTLAGCGRLPRAPMVQSSQKRLNREMEKFEYIIMSPTLRQQCGQLKIILRGNYPFVKWSEKKNGKTKLQTQFHVIYFDGVNSADVQSVTGNIFWGNEVTIFQLWQGSAILIRLSFQPSECLVLRPPLMEIQLKSSPINHAAFEYVHLWVIRVEIWSSSPV